MGALGTRRLLMVVAVTLTALVLVPAASAAPVVKTYRYGPVKLSAFTVKRGTALVPSPKIGGAITTMKARVVDGRGRSIPIQRVMLHHLLFKNLGRPGAPRFDGACPDIPRERFFGRGEEGITMELPEGYGYRIKPRETWQMNWMLMNHRQVPEVAWIEYQVTVDDNPAIVPVTPFWLDVADCHGGSIYDVPGGQPEGSQYGKSIDWKVPFDGRIVEATSHLHGGALGQSLFQPACGNRTLLDSYALYGMPDDPTYLVRPVLHEPAPVSTSAVRSRIGIPIHAGDRLVTTARYENSLPHPAAMAMLHVYAARAPAPVALCEPLPDDITNTTLRAEGRREPPLIRIPLTSFDGTTVRTVTRAPGRTVTLNGDATIDIRGFGYHPGNLSVPQGALLRWRFHDRELHNVTVANGPLGFASLHLLGGQTYRKRLNRPGRYELMCSLHPTSMHEVVTVRPR